MENGGKLESIYFVFSCVSMNQDERANKLQYRIVLNDQP